MQIIMKEIHRNINSNYPWFRIMNYFLCFILYISKTLPCLTFRDKKLIFYKLESLHVFPWLIHFNVWQNPLKYCKVISLQLIKINKLKKKTRKFIDDHRGRHDLSLPQHLSPPGATTHSAICVVSCLCVCFLGSRGHVSFSSNCWIPVTSQSGVQGPLSKCLLNCSYNGMKWQLSL